MIKPYLAAGVRKNGKGFIIQWIEPSGVTKECQLITCACSETATHRLLAFVVRKNAELGANPEIYKAHSRKLFKSFPATEAKRMLTHPLQRYSYRDLDRLGYGTRTTIWRKVRAGKFPAPDVIDDGKPYWLGETIKAHNESHRHGKD